MVAIDEVGATLNDLAVDPDVVKDILEILETGADELHSNPVGDVSDGSFGPGSDALDLSVNTAKAHRHVKQAMDDMVAGLRGFSANIKDFAQSAHVADDDSATRLAAIQQSTSCVAAPSFAAPSTCTLPTDGGA